MEDYPRFDKRGVREHFENKQREYWKREGIKKVVEWIETHSGEVILKIRHLNGMRTSESSTCLEFYKSEWQAFKEELGIEEV